MNHDADDSILQTLDALDERLRRVSWYLSGSEGEDVLRAVAAQGRDHTVHSRLAKLEKDFDKIVASSSTIWGLLQLRAKYPELFHPNITDVPTTLSTAELIAIIVSCAPSFPTTASRLIAVKDLPIPPAKSFAALIALQPRLAEVELLQQSQAKEMAELRARSARAVQRWYEVGVLEEGECWSEWEERCVEVEKKVRRAEMHATQEAKEKEAYR